MEEMEVKAQELKSQLEAINAERESFKQDIAEMQSKLQEAETKGQASEDEVKGIKEQINALNESLNEINKKTTMVEMERKGTFVDALREVFESDAFKSEFNELLDGKRAKAAFEVKTDPTSVILSGMTGDVTRTYAYGGIKGSLYEANKFLANMTAVPVPQDKNRAMWYDGTYYANVGYMTELTAITTGDGAAIEEKYRELAKVGAKLPFSSEVTDDMSYFINWARTKGVESVMSKIDDLIWGGAGADTTKPKEVYGIKTKGSTAFNAATAGLALAIVDANIADVILAGATQIRISGKGNYQPNAVFMHPTDVAKLRALKNTRADYINILPDGVMLVHGLVILETAKIAAGEMLIATLGTLQLHQKAGLEMEIERNASTNGYTMYMRWRGQVVVPTTDIIGNVYVANINTAIAAISSGVAVQYTYSLPTTTTTTTTSGS